MQELDYGDDVEYGDEGGDEGGALTVGGAANAPTGDAGEDTGYKSVVLFDDTTDEEEEDKETEEEQKKKKKSKGKKKPEELEEEKALAEKKKKAKERRARKRLGCPDFCKKHKIINKVKYWDEFVLEEYDVTDVRGASIVTGFYSESIAAGFAAQFIADELNLPLIGTMYAERGMPLCVVNMNQPTDIIRIYGNREIVVFTAQKVLGSDMCNAVVCAVFDFAQRHHCQQVIALEAFPKDLNLKVDVTDEAAIVEKLKKAATTDKPTQVRFLTNEPEVAKSLKAGGHKKIRGAMIVGVSGGIVSRASTSDMNVVCLVCPYNPLGGQSRASLLLVNLTSELVKIKVDSKTLEDEAEEMEREVMKQFDKSTSAKPVKHPSMYI